MPSRCKEAGVVFGLLLLLSLLPKVLSNESSCSSGYQFTAIPPITVVCNPFISHMDVICEITSAPDKPAADIHWYFQSFLAGDSSSPIRLVNGSHKHSIVNSYDPSKRRLKSVLRLHNSTHPTDSGQYICQGTIGSDKKLKPEPSFSLPSPPPVIFPPCKLFNALFESKAQRCADVIQASRIVVPSTSVALSSAFITSIIDSKESTVRATSDNITPSLSMIPSTSNGLIVTSNSEHVTPSFLRMLTSSTIINDVFSQSTSVTSLLSVDITTIIEHSSIWRQKPHVISTDTSGLSGTKSTNTLLSVITSTSLVVSSATPVIMRNTANISEGYALTWLIVIVALIASSCFILILILSILSLFFYCFQSSSSSSSAIGDVVLRQRTRRPSDPLPPIRDSMILMSNCSSETTTKSSNVSGGEAPAITTIHCSPLQNQFTSIRQSLQDVSFSLQCAAASGFTVYAEVEDLDETSSTNHDSSPLSLPPPLPDRNPTGTYSSHCYTLPEDAVFSAHDTDNDDESLTGQWSPILIYQEQKDEQQECDRLSLLSESDVTLSDIDDTLSSSYQHGNIYVFQQQLPNQTNSLAQQSFSINDGGPGHDTSLLQTMTTVSSSSHHSDQCITSLQHLFNADPQPSLLPDEVIIETTNSSRSDNIRSSSSSSSGCTDLSKYSGDYERDPNYMRALSIAATNGTVNDDHFQTGHKHYATSSLLYQENQESILNDRGLIGLDSGMDGMYCCDDDDDHSQYQQQWTISSEDYKSLESLTRNPSPVYMKPLWGKKRHSDSSNAFTTIAV